MHTLTATRLTSTTWLYAWAAATPPYRLYLHGRLLATQTGLTYERGHPAAADDPEPLEVLDATETDDPESIQHPGWVMLQWRRVVGAIRYAVYKRNPTSGAWSWYADLDAGARSYYALDSLAGWQATAEVLLLADATPAEFRIYAVDSNGNYSEPAEYAVDVARNPDAPAVEISYDEGTGDMTVEAA